MSVMFYTLAKLLYSFDILSILKIHFLSSLLTKIPVHIRFLVIRISDMSFQIILEELSVLFNSHLQHRSLKVVTKKY